MYRQIFIACLLVATPSLLLARNPPASDPQALLYAAQALNAMTGGMSLNDVTLTGSVTWDGTDTGTATLQALGTGESRIDVVFATGTRSDIRDAQTSLSLGQWRSPNNTSGKYASHNCWTDAVWFFPPLSSLGAGSNVVLTYVGQESRNGVAVQHIQSYVYQSDWPTGVTPTPQQLSTMDFFLDATTLLPLAITFNTHPDNDANTSLAVEVDFSNYQAFGSVAVPSRIKRYQQGNLFVDLTVSGASFNTGLQLSTFAIAQ